MEIIDIRVLENASVGSFKLKLHYKISALVNKGELKVMDKLSSTALANQARHCRWLSNEQVDHWVR